VAVHTHACITTDGSANVQECRSSFQDCRDASTNRSWSRWDLQAIGKEGQFFLFWTKSIINLTICGENTVQLAPLKSFRMPSSQTCRRRVQLAGALFGLAYDDESTGHCIQQKTEGVSLRSAHTYRSTEAAREPQQRTSK
jgi:hypothetical protein